jgi:drug/metabolite transporter (DMT)-like permease
VTVGVIRCGVAAILFGISAPAASRLTVHLDAFSLAGLLYLGAALAVAPVAGRTRVTRAAIRTSLPNLALAVVLGGAVGPVLLAIGLGLVPAATASLVLNLELVFTTIVAGVVFREYIGRHVIAGTLLVATGTAVLTWSGGPDLRLGALSIAAACLCWAIDNSATAAIDQIGPSHITLAKGVIAGGTNLIIGLIAGGGLPLAPALWALCIGAFGYGASITLWVSGARELGAARGQVVFAAAPFVGAIVAWTIFSDPASARELAAFVLAAFGIALVLRSHHDHRHVHKPVSHAHDHDHDEHHMHDHEAVVSGRHTHHHEHVPAEHRHPHVPDLHHRHRH